MAIRARKASVAASFIALAIMNEDGYDDVDMFLGGTPTLKTRRREVYGPNGQGNWGYHRTGAKYLDSQGHKQIITLCSKGFKKLTGIDMKNGDVKYFTITLKPTTAPVAKKKVAKKRKR